MPKKKYTPLDLSFLSNQYSPNANSISNTANMIMANAGWGPSTISIKEMADANKKAEAERKSLHKQSFLSSVFDLLQTPLYGVANALDESMAGHQSDSNDNVFEDVLKTAGGVVTGASKGLTSGLRGASGILDVLPGVDINDEWQSDPTDKTHFSDVAIRKATGMATGDAMKPENWEEILPKLKALQGKPLMDKTFFDLALPGNLDSEDAREKYFRNQMLTGIASDIGADPLNLVMLGGGAARGVAKATAGIDEGLEAARGAEGLNNAIKSGLESKSARPFEGKADLNTPSPVQAIAETVPAGAKFDIAQVGTVGEKPVKTLENLGRRETAAKAGVEVSGRDQQILAKTIVRLASSGDKTWMYKAADLLAKHPNVTWTETEKLLQTANNVIKKVGQRGVNGLAPALRARITADVNAVVRQAPVERRLLNENTDIIHKPGAPRLKASEAKLANQVVRRFEGEILGRKGAPGTYEGLVRAIASGNNVRYSGPQQARMWNQITSNLKYPNASKFDKAVRILRSVEDYYISKGMIPHSTSSLTAKKGIAGAVPLRLSQVAEAIGPQFLGKSHAFITGILRGDPKDLAKLTDEQAQAIEALKRSEALTAAPAVQKGLSAADEIAKSYTQTPLSAARLKDLMNADIKHTKTFVAGSGGGDAGARVVGEYMGNLLGKGDPVNKVLNANKLKTEEWLAKTGRPGIRHFMVNDPAFVRSVTNAISKAADLPSPASLNGLTGAAAKVTDWLGARFNAAYGVQDMRPIYLRQQSSAMETTARRARLINELGRRFDPNDADLWHEAFRAAQQNGITDGRIAELQGQISKAMENLFGGTGLRNGAIADSTVVGRNRLLMDELNSNLKRFGLGKYQFSADKNVKDALGAEHDLSKGLDWMKSWELWDIKKPYEFLHKVQNAIEHTVREKTMFDEIVSRFGSPIKKGQVKYGVDHPRLRGYYFTPEAAQQAKVFVRMLDEVSTPNSRTLQYFDHVLSKLKASLTIYIPGHHMTNLIGDTYYNWIAGVNKPIRYDQAVKVMLAQKGRYGDFASFDKLHGPEALKQAMARSLVKPDAGLAISPAGNKAVITMRNGTKVTADMIYTAAFKEGILPSARVLEDVASDVSSVLDKIRPLGGRGQRAVHQVSEIRDHIPRLAQFIDGLAKHSGSFSDAATSSAAAVRKWHPDGLDLTHFERQFMKRALPFYSWTRKSIPLAIESVIFNGPKVMAYPRLMEAIGLANGNDPSQQITDPFPTDQMFPDWLRDRGIGPIMGGAGNYSVINPSTPVLDTLTLLGHPGQSSLDMMNPMLKVPIETMQGQTLGRSVPIGTSNQAWMDYAAKQIPVVSQAGRASGQFGVSDSTKDEGFPNWTNILNLLTGAKKVDSGKYQKSAQFDIREYLKAMKDQQGR